MNGTCPDCEAPLKNPKACSCGWRLQKLVWETISINPISTEQRERNRDHAKRLKDFAHNLGKVYEPGQDG